MPSIPITNYQAGTAMVAANVNTDFTAIATASAILDDENTRTEWCSRYHMDEVGANFINDTFSSIEDSDTTMVVTTNVFGVVALVPNFRISLLGLAFLPGETMRMHFDVNAVAAVPAGANILTNINSDCYQFRFFFRDSVSGVTAAIGSTSTYSTGSRSDHIPASGGSTGGVSRIGQRVNHSYCWINTTGATINIDWIEIRVRLCEVAFLTSVSLKDATFQTFRARH